MEVRHGGNIPVIQHPEGAFQVQDPTWNYTEGPHLKEGLEAGATLPHLTEHRLKGPKFNSQQLHGGSKPSVTPAPGDLMLSSDLVGHQAHTQYTYIHAGKTHIKINKYGFSEREREWLD